MREYFVLGSNVIKVDNYRILEQLDSMNLVSGLNINTYISGLSLTVIEVTDRVVTLLMNY